MATGELLIVKEKLKEAAHRLEFFATDYLNKSVVEKSRIKKTINFFRYVFHSKPFSSKEIVEAIELIKSQRILIQTLMKKGDDLGDKVYRAVYAYNNCCHTKKWKKQLSLPKIEIPALSIVRQEYAGTESGLPIKHVFSTEFTEKQVIELFHMKALVLLERYRLATNPEARKHVIQTPILRRVKDSVSCLLEQELILFPGQTITIKALSSVDPKTTKINLLFPETFALSLHSKQTGIPHPLQCSGWALGYPLIPDNPQYLDLLGNATDFFITKQKAIQALLPGGAWIGVAKTMMKLKIQAFGKHSLELLDLHRELAVAMVSTSTHIDVFYDLLKTHQTPFEYLAETSQTIFEIYLIRPYEELLKTSLNWEVSDPDINDQTSRQIFENNIQQEHFSVLERLENSKEPMDLAKWRYVATIGKYIGMNSISIILQHISEDFKFSPPPLNAFEECLQTASYRQTLDFFEELKNPINSLEDVYRQIKRSLLADIALFKYGKLPVEATKIVKALKLYFSR